MSTSMTPIRRVLGLLFGAALFALGAWLLYRHLLFGDRFSVGLTLAATLMVGSGLMTLPSPFHARRTLGRSYAERKR